MLGCDHVLGFLFADALAHRSVSVDILDGGFLYQLGVVLDAPSSSLDDSLINLEQTN